MEAELVGGILISINSNVNISECDLRHASANQGAALSINFESELEVRDSHFLNCTSKTKGSGIYADWS